MVAPLSLCYVTALYGAVNAGHTLVVKYLLSMGVRSKPNSSPLALAAYNGHMGVAGV